MFMIKNGKNPKSKQNNKVPLPKCGYYLNTIYFYITEGCNLNCRHCWIAPRFHGKNSKVISPFVSCELFKNIIYQAKELGLGGVKLTGGEPLIHPEIEKILDFIKQEDLQLTIETNGTKCTPVLAEKISQCKYPSVSVSLDGADAKTHEWVRGVRGSYKTALQGIRNLVNANLRPQIIMSIMRHNVEQLEAVVRLAEKENVGSIKLSLVTPTARGKQLHDAGEALSIKELLDLGKWIENKLVPSTELTVVYSHPMAFKPLNKVFQPSGSCGIFGIIGVLGSGKYALCGIGETVPELVFGHAEKNKLADVWNNNKVLQDIREGLPRDLKGICGDCLMKQNCLASCVAMNYYRHQDLFAPHWYCEEAHKIGLFPAARILPNSKSEQVSQCVT